jgi:hypothetical protein
VGDIGLEQGAETPRISGQDKKGGAESGALVALSGSVSDPDLAELIAVWPTLPAAKRAAISALVAPR